MRSLGSNLEGAIKHLLVKAKGLPVYKGEHDLIWLCSAVKVQGVVWRRHQYVGLIGGGLTRMHVAFSVNSTSNVTVLLNRYCFCGAKSASSYILHLGVLQFLLLNICALNFYWTGYWSIKTLSNGILVH